MGWERRSSHRKSGSWLRRPGRVAALGGCARPAKAVLVRSQQRPLEEARLFSSLLCAENQGMFEPSSAGWLMIKPLAFR